MSKATKDSAPAKPTPKPTAKERLEAAIDAGALRDLSRPTPEQAAILALADLALGQEK